MKNTILIYLVILTSPAFSNVKEVKCQKVEISAISEEDKPVCWMGAKDFWVYNKKITKGGFDYEVDLSPLRSALRLSQAEYRLKMDFLNQTVGFCWNDEVGSSSGLWRTTDGGLTWTVVADGEVRKCVANVSSGGMYFYNRSNTSSPPLILWIDSKGEIASKIDLPRNTTFGNLVISIDGKTLTGTFYSNDSTMPSNRFFVSMTKDGGKSWKTLRAEAPAKQGHPMAADAHGRMQFLESGVGATGHRLYLSEPPYNQWKSLPGSGWVEVYFTSGKYALGLRTPKNNDYAFKDLELWQSNDHGSHWSRLQDKGASTKFLEELFQRVGDWQNGQQWVLRHLAEIP